MSKSITVEIPEGEAANLEAALDELLTALRKLENERDPVWEQVDRLKGETHVMMAEIKAALNVEETL